MQDPEIDLKLQRKAARHHFTNFDFYDAVFTVRQEVYALIDEDVWVELCSPSARCSHRPRSHGELSSVDFTSFDFYDAVFTVRQEVYALIDEDGWVEHCSPSAQTAGVPAH
jgi:hypothetical protein